MNIIVFKQCLATIHYAVTRYFLVRNLVVLFIAILPLAGVAEIYQCLDAKGRPSFSNTPCPDSAVVGRSEAHRLWREMRVLVSEGHSINRLLGADVESIKNCNKSAQQFSEKLDKYNERLMALSSVKHKHLFKAMDYIRACGECRVAAANDCKKASTQLDEQMIVLLEMDRKKSK